MAWISGNNANNYLQGTDGDDWIDGYEGDDYLFGNSGRDTIFGGGGRDLILGGYGNDEIYGGYGDDFLIGESGSDYLTGDSGADILVGGYGNDYLYGDYGPDKLNGNGHGYVSWNSRLVNTYSAPDDIDYLYGGVDNHQDLYYLGDDRTYYRGSGFAMIYDFNVNYDKIVIGNDASFSRISIGASGGNTEIRFDGNLIGLIAGQNLSNYNTNAGKDFLMDFYYQHPI